jgi:hypothetical protein
MGLPMNDYNAYLKSPQWAERSRAALSRAENRCQLCYSGEALNVHHRTYVRLRCERPADLTVLCRDCHVRHHEVLPLSPSSLIATIRLIASTLEDRQAAFAEIRAVLIESASATDWPDAVRVAADLLYLQADGRWRGEAA